MRLVKEYGRSKTVFSGLLPESGGLPFRWRPGPRGIAASGAKSEIDEAIAQAHWSVTQKIDQESASLRASSPVAIASRRLVTIAWGNNTAAFADGEYLVDLYLREFLHLFA